MNQDDYKEKIEEHRKPIKIDGEERRTTRTSRRSSGQPVKPVKKRRNFLLPILFAIFILIPVGFLIYIQVFYEPTPNKTAVIETDEVEFEENEEDSLESEVADEADENNSDSDSDTETTENQNTDSAVEEESAGSVERVLAEDVPTVEEPEEVQPDKDNEEPTSGKTHIVQPNETLYRIAMNYYHSPDAVDKIKEANGLSSDSISTGQTLILP
ncbi:MAG: LysM peptidoglycan-binding domain-containing protein [Paenisporosarcina sp.]